jgi:hypothetical protein
MGKKIFFGALLLTSLFVRGQSGITQLTLGGFQFLMHLPQGYKTGQLVNVFIQAPGSGEVAGPIAKDTINGPFAWWNGHPGIKDTTVLDPNLVVLAWNPGTGWVVNSQVQTVISSVRNFFNVNRIAVAGLSEGCQDWTDWAYSSYSNFSQIAAFFLFSPEETSNPPYGPGTQCRWFLSDSAYFYAACAQADPDGFYGPLLLEFDSIQAFHLYRTPELTTMSCACHSSAAWGQFFSPYWKDQVTGRNIYDQFMYEFPVGGAAAPVPVPTTPMPAPAKTIKSILITYSDGSTQSLP